MSENIDETKTEDTTIEHNKPEETGLTTITVPIPETKNDDPSVEEVEKTINDTEAEEQFSIKPTISPDSPQVKKVVEEQKEYLLKRAKDSNIDINTIEYDEDGITPKITDEMLEIFSMYSNGIMDKEFFQIYVDQAKMIIEQYKDFKNTVDNGMADEDDMEYYAELTKSYEESRLIMALVQNEYNSIMKDFKENKIFENQSKYITLSLLRDFLVNNFRLTDSWLNQTSDPKEISKMDKTVELENRIREQMFISPIFYEYARKMMVLAMVNPKETPFSASFLDNHFENLVYGLDSYIKHSGKTHDIDLKTIITRDMNNMNFVKAILTIMFIENNDEFIGSTTITDKSVETLKKKLNPNNIYDETIKHLYLVFNTLYEKFENIEFVNDLLYKCENSLKNDKLYKTINIPIEEPYDKFIIEFSSKLPDITGTSIVKWGKYYSYLKKYELYHSVDIVKKILCDKDKNGDEYTKQKRTMIIDCISNYLVEYLNMIYGQMISDIDLFVKENVYSKPMRETIFSMLMNNILMQHELGFKSDFDPEIESSGDGLYKLAEKVFGDQYKFIIIDKEKDILLKNVDLKKTRKTYFDIIEKLIEFMSYDYNNNEIHTKASITKHNFKKLNNRKRKHKR